MLCVAFFSTLYLIWSQQSTLVGKLHFYYRGSEVCKKNKIFVGLKALAWSTQQGFMEKQPPNVINTKTTTYFLGLRSLVPNPIINAEY